MEGPEEIKIEHNWICATEQVLLHVAEAEGRDELGTSNNDDMTFKKLWRPIGDPAIYQDWSDFASNYWLYTDSQLCFAPIMSGDVNGPALNRARFLNPTVSLWMNGALAQIERLCETKRVVPAKLLIMRHVDKLGMFLEARMTIRYSGDLIRPSSPSLRSIPANSVSNAPFSLPR
jgi:hypothetical protein